MKAPAVYILASQRNGTLYIGVTSDLIQRIWQHREGVVEGFTQQHSVKTLVWYEQHETMESAISREKQLKKWNRDWKLRLIEKQNPQWLDLWPEITGAVPQHINPNPATSSFPNDFVGNSAEPLDPRQEHSGMTPLCGDGGNAASAAISSFLSDFVGNPADPMDPRQEHSGMTPLCGDGGDAASAAISSFPNDFVGSPAEPLDPRQEHSGMTPLCGDGGDAASAATSSFPNDFVGNPAEPLEPRQEHSGMTPCGDKESEGDAA
jgi:predicted GIY-YIG superfamily endonuclease